MTFDNLCSQLYFTEWVWEASDVSAKLLHLGWKFIREVGDRTEYQIEGHLNGNVYCQQEQVEFLEITLEAFTNVEALDFIQYEDMNDRFYHKFHETSRAVEYKLGQPVFCNNLAAVGFPDDQDAAWLALWNSPSCRLMIQQKHEDRNLPFRICIVLTPHRQGICNGTAI